MEEPIEPIVSPDTELLQEISEKLNALQDLIQKFNNMQQLILWIFFVTVSVITAYLLYKYVFMRIVRQYIKFNF